MRLKYYITKTLQAHGYSHNFVNSVKNANIPHDSQDANACFCLSSVVMRRILAIIEPEKYNLIGSKKDAEKTLNDTFGSGPAIGDPVYAFETIIGGKPKHLNINSKNMPFIIDHCSKWPVILPYCSPPKTGLFVKMSPKDYVDNILRAGESIANGKNPQLHSMCAVGTVIDDGVPHFVCVQTWDNCEIALIPIITNDALQQKCIDNNLINSFNLNICLLHDPTSDASIFPMPLNEPISYHEAPCLHPVIATPLIYRRI